MGLLSDFLNEIKPIISKNRKSMQKMSEYIKGYHKFSRTPSKDFIEILQTESRISSRGISK